MVTSPAAASAASPPPQASPARRDRRLPIGLAALLLLAGACRPPAAPPPEEPGSRDFSAHPAVLERGPAAPLYAVSDIHGAYDRLVALLLRHGLIPAAPAAPEAVGWSGGGAVLVVTGDLFDKGPAGLAVVDLLRALQERAAAASPAGQVIVTLGNHEAEFLADPENDKATAEAGITAELRARGLDPRAVAEGREPRGRWLRELPFAARVGSWFFSHGGNSAGRSAAALEESLRAALLRNGFADGEIVGDGSLLEASGWFAGEKGLGARYAAALGVAHLVFGHDPSALGSKGVIGLGEDGALFRIDCGMSPNIGYSEGALLRVTVEAGREVAAALTPDGLSRELWKGPK